MKVYYFAVPLLATLAIVFLERFRSKYVSALRIYQDILGDQEMSYYNPAKLTHPIPIQICPYLMATSKYALVSMLTIQGGREVEHYTKALEKLDRAVDFLSGIDAVLFLVDRNSGENSSAFMTKLRRWGICKVSVLEGPASTQTNRYLDAKMYSKLQVWLLQEYQAIMYIDADTLLVRQFSSVFDHHLNLMVNAGFTIGMSTNGKDEKDDFNAGVILLIPNRTEFQILSKNMHTTKHNLNLAEQSYLNEFYKARIYTLPVEFNGMVSVKNDNPVFWEMHESRMILFHYTCKPWHFWNCFRDNIEDLCLLWYWVWPV